MTYNIGKHQHASKQPVSVQTRPDQIKNDAGGYVFQASDMDRFNRFLILGVLSGTLYMERSDKVNENLDLLKEMILAGKAQAMLERADEVSQKGLAESNEPAIITLAFVLRYGSNDDKFMAGALVPSICRTGTHILHLAKYVNDMKAWGRAVRRAVGGWYTRKTPAQLAFQLAKYQGRDGWTHRDVLRLAHPKTPEDWQPIIRWAVKGEVPAENENTRIIVGLEKAKGAEHPEWTVGLIRDYHLSREMVTTDHLTDPGVMAALFEEMPMTAMLRNLGNYAAAGLHNVGQRVRDLTIERLNNAKALEKGRIHPMDVAMAALVYGQGHGVRGGKIWKPAPAVSQALETAFELSFKYQKPTGKRYVLAIDVSGSMMSQSVMSGLLNCAEAASLMAYIFTRIEKNVTLLAFSDHCYEPAWADARSASELYSKFGGGGGTNMSSVFEYMIASRAKCDTLVILSDMQTWADASHPYSKLSEYRREISPAKFVSACVDANGYTVSAPEDADVLDVVGFDASLPSLIQTFTMLGLDELAVS